LPCDLHDDIHDAGRSFAGLLQALVGAGPMFSSVLYISNIFIACVFNTYVHVKLILCRM